MKIYKNVRGTAEYIPSLEVNVDTVYIRSNIERVEEMEFSGWEYDEIQYGKDEYIERISKENDFLNTKIKANAETLELSQDVLQELILAQFD